MNFRSHVLAHGLLCAVLAVPLPAPAGELAAAPQRLPRCEPPMLGRDRLVVVCALNEAASPHRVHIRVHFTGSHDDTTASMDITLDDAAVACDAGSKTNTEGEDGDVTLDCRFSADGKAGSARVVRASARWFHAQFVGVEVNGQRP